MKIGITGRIDVQKIIRDAMFKGQKGTYLDFKTFIEIDVQDQYGNNGFISQEMGKDAQDRGPILGNVKVFWNDSEATQAAPQQHSYQQAPQQAPQQQRQTPQQQQQQYQQERQQPPAQYQQSPNQNVPNANDFDDDIPF